MDNLTRKNPHSLTMVTHHKGTGSAWVMQRGKIVAGNMQRERRLLGVVHRKAAVHSQMPTCYSFHMLWLQGCAAHSGEDRHGCCRRIRLLLLLAPLLLRLLRLAPTLTHRLRPRA